MTRVSRRGNVIDAVPQRVRDAAYRAFELRLPGIPVADIVRDDLMERPDGEAIDHRTVVFRSGERTVRVDVDRGSRESTYSLLLTPPRDIDVTVLWDRGLSHDRGPEATRVRARGGRASWTAAGGLATAIVEFPSEDGGVLRTAWLRW